MTEQHDTVPGGPTAPAGLSGATSSPRTARAEQVPAARTAPEPLTPTPVEAPEPLSDAPTGPAAGRGKHSRRWWLAMTRSIVGFGVLAAGITLGPTSYRMWTQKDADLSTPPQAAGLTLDTTEMAKSAADDLRTVLDAGFALEDTVAAVYGDPAQASRSVLFVGGTAFLARPDKELDQLFALLDDQAGGVRDVKAVDPGKLGGVMRCGAAEGSDTVMSICGWADHGSIALAMFPGRTADESAALLRDLRTTLEHRD